MRALALEGCDLILTERHLIGFASPFLILTLDARVLLRLFLQIGWEMLIPLSEDSKKD